jgi:hypothetical protein
MFTLDALGRIGFAEVILAADDGLALTKAREMNPDAVKCELWEGNRLVATLTGQELAIDPA